MLHRINIGEHKINLILTATASKEDEHSDHAEHKNKRSQSADNDGDVSTFYGVNGRNLRGGCFWSTIGNVQHDT